MALMCVFCVCLKTILLLFLEAPKKAFNAKQAINIYRSRYLHRQAPLL